eukprot:6361123-Prymnesium_polylepis.1
MHAAEWASRGATTSTQRAATLIAQYAAGGRRSRSGCCVGARQHCARTSPPHSGGRNGPGFAGGVACGHRRAP